MSNIIAMLPFIKPGFSKKEREFGGGREDRVFCDPHALRQNGEASVCDSSAIAIVIDLAFGWMVVEWGWAGVVVGSSQAQRRHNRPTQQPIIIGNRRSTHASLTPSPTPLRRVP